MAQYHFGAGNFFGIVPGATPTPIKLGALQDVDINFSGNIKELHGQNKYALVVAQGQMKVQGKAKFGQIVIEAYNQLFFGQTTGAATGQVKFADNELGTIPGSVAYTVTVANGATFDTDLGVIDATTGKPFKRVAAAPAAGEYTLNTTTGVYTFAVADANKKVYISYMYKVAASGKTLTLTNSAMGAAPTFKGIFAGQFSGKQVLMCLNACTSSKLKVLDTKLEDFTIPELEFSAFCDDAGVLGFLSTDE